MGLVSPIKVWTLSQGQGGNLISTLKDNSIGKISSYSITAFQRGYEAKFILNPKVYQYSQISEGDTVATMYSNKDEERLVQLEGELNVQTSELRLYTTGQKSQDVQGIAEKVALAKQALDMQRRLTHRSEALYQDSLISTQEYESSVDLLRARELEVRIAEASYHSASTGGKPEQIQFVMAKIEAIKQQINQIKNGLKDFTLVSPITGMAIQKKYSNLPYEEILASIADTSSYIVQFPVAYDEKVYLHLDQPVEVEITGTRLMCKGKIIGIDNTAQIIDGRQAFFATALLKQKGIPIISGTILRTTILCEPITVSQYIGRSIRTIFVY
jgi:HlyD family secretion protein